MHSKIKINLKKYVLLSLPILGISLGISSNTMEIIAILLAYLFTLVNQILLVYGVTELLNPAYIETPSERPMKLIVFSFIAKLFILAGVLVFCEQFMGKRVIIPVINYVILIFVMFYSIEKKVNQ
ncbi:MAG: hypothetical protein KAG61_07000 [Bacteriovoracaceae bacterium]|nr:hypothetical protein [Bacteriovoracaceae bacterium]